MNEDRKLKLTALLLALLLWFYVSGPGWPFPGLVETDPGRTVVSISLEMVNLPDNLELNALPEKVRVGLIAPEYPEEEIGELLSAYLDFEHVVPGVYWLPVVLDHPQEWEIDFISPRSIQVDVWEGNQ